ncbi:MAG: hypothetical protein ABUT20_11850, partial [Bacteroidota bacterium]
MKSLICLGLSITICFNFLNAQTDSLQKKDSSPVIMNYSPISLKPVFSIQKDSFAKNNPFHFSVPFEKNYTQRRYDFPNTVTGNTLNFLGNILISIFAEKTNHVYAPANNN